MKWKNGLLGKSLLTRSECNAEDGGFFNSLLEETAWIEDIVGIENLLDPSHKI